MLGKNIDLTLDTFAAKWLQNAMLNGRKLFIRDLLEMEGKLDVERAIVCGTGPSLDIDLGSLKNISVFSKDRTIILANHSNLATLLFFEVVPDIVVIADSGEATFTRLKRDVIPHFKSQLRKKTIFCLPSHAHPDLIDLINSAHLPIFCYGAAFSNAELDDFRLFYNQVLDSACPPVRTFIAQAGSVSNACVLLCHCLKVQGKMPNLEEVILSGVDYSYPNGITRCTQVTWNAELKDFNVDEKPTNLGPEIIRETYGGMPTSEEQMSYYKDLRFISRNLEDEKGRKLFSLYTSQPNFLTDFLELKRI